MPFNLQKLLKYRVSLIICVILIVSTQVSYAQESDEEITAPPTQEVVNYKLLLSRLLNSRDTLIIIKNKHVDLGNLRVKDINRLSKRIEIDSGRVVVNKNIEFHNCTIVGRGLSDVIMKNVLLKNCEITSFTVSNFIAENLTITGGIATRIRILKSNFGKLTIANLRNEDEERGTITLYKGEITDQLVLSNNKFFQEISVNSNVLARLVINNNESKSTTLANNQITNEVLVHDETAEEFMFRKNIITSMDSLRNTFQINCEKLIVIDNNFEVPVLFADSEVSLRVEMADNRFQQPADFHDVSFPEFGKYIPFSQFEAGFVVYQNLYDEDSPDGANCYYCEIYRGITDEELADKTNFDKLVQSYEILFLGYKSTGDIESANLSYIRIKDLYLNRLGYIYHDQGGFKNYFRWKLAQLLKFYTNHGTDPALSIVISIYVILVFALFYIFFPSEWDVTSKARLIANFREFADKNDKGRLKPFITLLVGFAISIFNAITLSLNSFVTLGFGTIPTSGAARYVCILQGFIGWFLLSIFTVSLINQILF